MSDVNFFTERIALIWNSLQLFVVDFRSLSSSTELSISLVCIYLHDIDVLCGFLTCTVSLLIFIACVYFVVIVILLVCDVSVACGPLSQINKSIGSSPK